jgi:hypothetical protein
MPESQTQQLSMRQTDKKLMMHKSENKTPKNPVINPKKTSFAPKTAIQAPTEINITEPVYI